MGRVIHFEIPAKSPEKLTGFYKDVFGWTFQKWGDMDYWLTDTGPKDKPGIGGAISKDSKYLKSTVNTLDVSDIHESMESIKKHGGKILTEIMDIPNVGKFCYCKDPEGNIFGIMQSTGSM